MIYLIHCCWLPDNQSAVPLARRRSSRSCLYYTLLEKERAREGGRRIHRAVASLLLLLRATTAKQPVRPSRSLLCCREALKLTFAIRSLKVFTDLRESVIELDQMSKQTTVRKQASKRARERERDTYRRARSVISGTGHSLRCAEMSSNDPIESDGGPRATILDGDEAVALAPLVL